MNQILSLGTWVSLPNEVRYKLRAIFNIPRSSNTVVNDGRIESDGTTYEDIKAISVEKMQKYLDDETTDFFKLFDSVVARVVDELSGKKETIEVSASEPVTITIDAPKKRGRPKKNGTKK